MIESFDLSAYKRQTCVYLLDSLSDATKVFYLHKTLKPKEPTYMKLIGWGGDFEDVDGQDPIACAIRELQEELSELAIRSGLELKFKREDVILQGVLIREDKKRAIYILKAKCPKGLREGLVEREGMGLYKPIDYYKTNPDMFLENDKEFLPILYYSDVEFRVNVDENVKVVDVIRYV